MSDRKEYIERGALLDYLGADLEEDLQPEVVMEFVESIPTADVVEVVRCGECKHNECGDCVHPNNVSHSYDCDWNRYDHHLSVSEEHFCSYGERKDGDNNATD